MRAHEGAGLRIEQTIGAEVKVFGEPFLLRQALGNLLDNALDFTPARRGVAVQRTDPAQRCADQPVQPGRADSRLRLAAPERAFLLAAASGQRAQSTGLGLNFVEEVMKLHGGVADRQYGGVQVVLHLHTVSTLPT